MMIDGTKVVKIGDICKKKRKYFSKTWNNVE